MNARGTKFEWALVLFAVVACSALVGAAQASAVDQGVHSQSSSALSVIHDVPDTPPETWFVGVPPAYTLDPSISFDLGSNVLNPEYVCSINGDDWEFLPGSFDLEADDGKYTIECAAVDEEGNIDPTPAVHSWVVDRTGPQVNVVAPPNGWIAALLRVGIRFSIFSLTPPTTAECQLDNGSFVACGEEGFVTPNLAPGAHIFVVRVTDRFGRTAIDRLTFTTLPLPKARSTRVLRLGAIEIPARVSLNRLTHQGLTAMLTSASPSARVTFSLRIKDPSGQWVALAKDASLAFRNRRAVSRLKVKGRSLRRLKRALKHKRKITAEIQINAAARSGDFEPYSGTQKLTIRR